MAKIILLLLLVGISLQDMQEIEVNRESCASSNDVAQILLALKKLQQTTPADEEACEKMNDSKDAKFTKITRNLERSEEHLQNAKLELQQLQASHLTKQKCEDERTEPCANNKSAECNAEGLATQKAIKGIMDELKNILISIRDSVQKVSSCIDWKARFGGLEIKKLQTGIYYFHTQEMSQPLASVWCSGRGMQLAQLHTHEEMKVIMDNAPVAFFWVGGSDIGHTPGQFFWNDGEKVAADMWFTGHPHGHGPDRATCIQVNPNNKKLAAHTCATRFRPLCEVASEFLGCL